MTRPSVAVVSTYYHPVLGGAEAAAERLAVFLSRRGHAVRVFTKRTSAAHPPHEQIDGVSVLRLPPVGERSGSGKWVWLPWLLSRLLAERRGIDVVCCVDYRGIGLAALAARVATHTPVIFQAQTEGVLSAARVREWLGRAGLSPDGTPAQIVTAPVRGLYGRADAIACISRALEQEAIAAGVPRARVHYLPNPVDTSLFSPAAPDERAALRQQAGIPPTEVVGVFVGRLSREKGVMELVRAWALGRPRATLVLVGPPMPDHAWDVSGEARAFVDREGLADQIRFAGAETAQGVARWLKLSDFAVQPSHFEAMGLAAAEAMAAGLPVIASDAVGFRDFVVDGQTGLVVPARDVDALAVALTRLATDAVLRARLGAAALDASRPFDQTVVLTRFAQLIDALAAGGPGRGNG